MKLIIINLFFISLSFSSEVDSFTGRYHRPSDSLFKINDKANELLEKAVRIANQKQIGCSEKKVYKILRKRFRNKMTDELSVWIHNTADLDSIRTPVENSIYHNWKWFEAIIPGLYARVFKDPSARLLQVNGELIGDDKFEHFMGSGFAYFRRFYLNRHKYDHKNEGMIKALKIGYRAETSFMGASTTGVMAYADLSANFNGMRFWNHMLQKREDIFGLNIGPLISCEKQKWSVVGKIDFSNYIDASFDEAINCSAFRNKKLLRKVKRRLKKMSKRDGLNYTCPMEPKKLEEILIKYGKFSKYLINTKGHIIKPKMKFKEYINQGYLKRN